MIRLACRFQNAAVLAAPQRSIGSKQDDFIGLPWTLLQPRDTPVKADVLKLFAEIKTDFPRAVALLEQYKSDLDYSKLQSIHKLCNTFQCSADASVALRTALEDAYLLVLSTQFNDENFAEGVEKLQATGRISGKCLTELETLLWNNMEALSPAQVLTVFSALSRNKWRPNNDGLAKLVSSLTQIIPSLDTEEATHLTWLAVIRHRFYTDELIKVCKEYTAAHWRRFEGAQISRMAHVFLYCNQPEPFEHLNKAADAQLHTMTTSHVADFVGFAGHANSIDQRFLYKLVRFSKGFWQHYSSFQLSVLFVTFCCESPHSTGAMQEILDAITKKVHDYDAERLNRILAMCDMVDCLDTKDFHKTVRRHIEQNRGLLPTCISASKFLLQNLSVEETCVELCDKLKTLLCSKRRDVRYHDITTALTMCIRAKYYDEEFLALSAKLFQSEIHLVRDLRFMARSYSVLLRSGKQCVLPAVEACQAEIIRRCYILQASDCVNWTDQGLLSLGAQATGVPSVAEVAASDLLSTCITLFDLNYYSEELRAVIPLLAGNTSFALGLNATEFIMLLKLLQRAHSMTHDVSRSLAVAFIKVHLSPTMKREHTVKVLQEMSLSALSPADFRDLFDACTSTVGDLSATELMRTLKSMHVSRVLAGNNFLFLQKMLLPKVGELQATDLFSTWKRVQVLPSSLQLPSLSTALCDGIFENAAESDFDCYSWMQIAMGHALSDEQRKQSLESLSRVLCSSGQGIPEFRPVYDRIPPLCKLMLNLEFAPPDFVDALEQLFDKYPEGFVSCQQMLPALRALGKSAAGP